MASSQLLWIKQLTNDSLSFVVDLSLYPLEVVFRACYVFTDKCYLFLSPEEDEQTVRVQVTRKSSNCDLSAMAGEFSNELINQRVRTDIAKETRTIRDLIVAQAFAEADFVNGSDSNASYNDDPKGISK